jgi:hypothetical protein
LPPEPDWQTSARSPKSADFVEADAEVVDVDVSSDDLESLCL